MSSSFASQHALMKLHVHFPSIAKYNLALIAEYYDVESDTFFYAFNNPEDKCVNFYIVDSGVVLECNFPPYALLKLLGDVLATK